MLIIFEGSIVRNSSYIKNFTLEKIEEISFLIYILESIFSEILCLDSHDLCEKLTGGWGEGRGVLV